MRAGKNNGFTLVEVLVTLGIFVLVIGAGLGITFDFYKSSSFHSEEELLVSALKKARSEALNNIANVRHGVHLAAAPSQYIIFECPQNDPECKTYAPSSSDLFLDPKYNIAITTPSLPFDIVFEQLSGNCINCLAPLKIEATDGVKNFVVTVNKEGGIDW